MSLSDLASLGSFVSGAAVLGSLVFLFFQMRQMTEQVKQAERNQQAAIRQGRAAMQVDLNMRIAEGLSDVYLPLTRGETADDINQVRRYMLIALAAFQLLDEQYEQYREGLLTDSAFQGFRKVVQSNMRQPGRRVAWTRLRQSFGEPFAAFIDQALAETTPIGPGEWMTLEHWNSGIAAEIGADPRLMDASPNRMK